jgi:ATP phosphoribosyltransferase regulatory subunit
MAAETAKQFDALEAQAQRLMSVFAKAGHEAVAPAIIQPADVFLDVIGEALRARTYVFTDPDGAELCLRPDLTVPTCRLHLSRHADPARQARYCYNGPAFRYQPQGADEAHPREFRQAGIERFGDTDTLASEAETIALIIKAIEAAGLTSWTLRLGDLGLFAAVLKSAALPDRWQRRLDAAFWRPDAFRDEVARLTVPDAVASRIPRPLVSALGAADPAVRTAAVQDYLDANGFDVFGVRTVDEVTARLADMAADLTAAPLDRASADLIASYVSISGPARTAGATIAALLKSHGKNAGAVLDRYDRRLALLGNAGIDLDRVSFSAEFGRNLEYYTGLVFEVVAPALGAKSPVAGGGRYDKLMRSAGAAVDVPAVGAAIHTERLLAAVKGRTAKGGAA